MRPLLPNGRHPAEVVRRAKGEKGEGTANAKAAALEALEALEALPTGSEMSIGIAKVKLPKVSLVRSLLVYQTCECIY